MYTVNLPYDGLTNVYDYNDGIDILKIALKNNITYSKGKGENARTYSNIIMSFDIETTRVLNADWSDKFPVKFKYFNVVFCWQCSINGLFIFGRDIADFWRMIDTINNINPYKHIIIFVHNLAYEFNNLCDYFLARCNDPENDLFFKTRSTPLFARCGRFEFRCSKELTHHSLAKIGDNIGYKKLKGDFDYNVERYINSDLTPLELNYCYRDVIILYKYITEETISYSNRLGLPVNPCNLPLTSTGYVRNDVKKNFSKTPSGMLCLQQTALCEGVYRDINGAFWGGYTHADYKKVGKPLYNIGHRDITSAYPTMFIQLAFPFRLTLAQDLSTDLYLKNLNRDNFAQICNITLKNVTLKKHNIPYIPSVKCSGQYIDENGKIVFADNITFWVCDLDMKIILNVYNIKPEDITINKLYFGFKKRLPYRLINTVLKYFKGKTELKHGDPVEYTYLKSLLNGIYGLSATALIHSTLRVNDDLLVNPTGTEYKQASVIPYQFAIYITAGVRSLLYGFIYDLATKYGDAFVYSDTDSIFYIKSTETEKYFDGYNAKNREYMEIIRHIYPNAIPTDDKGNPQYLGAFEDENDDIAEFGTIGAKRYYIKHSNGLIDVTFAGLRATKIKDNENGFNTQRLIDMYGDINKAFLQIKNSVVNLPYVDGIDKLSIYNVRAPFHGFVCGVEVWRPCTYTLYGQGTTLSLNSSLYEFLKGEHIEE